MLTRKIDPEGAWYPVAIHQYETLLEKVICRGRGYTHVYALRKNIAYNLQYLEFLYRSLEDLKLSSVIEKQIWKNFIITGCGVIESLLHFLLIAKKQQKTTVWELKFVAPGQDKTIDDKHVRIDSHVYRKLSSPRNEEMTFDSMIKRAEKKKVLGGDHSVYARLNNLRRLRNRIHLQEIGNPLDTDWNAIGRQDFLVMTSVLKAVLTGSIFQPTAEQRGFFAYLPETQPA
jgi:hypothetical protein